MISNNSKLVFYYGAMGCGKTRELLKSWYSMKEDGFNPIIIKASKDKKGGATVVSRDNGSANVDILVGDEDNIYLIMVNYLINHNVDVILVDEAQFFKKEQVVQLSDIVDYLGIDVICYGLLTDFQTNLFEGSKRLIELADNRIEMERKCSCGNKKGFNARFINGEFVLDGDQVAIDGMEATYDPLCRRCYKKLVKNLNK